MVDGIYSMIYRGAANWGQGLLLLRLGTITGADIGGALYDGSYVDVGDSVKVDLTMRVPPGVALVQGTPPQAVAYDIPIRALLPKNALATQAPVLIDLPPGPVNAIFRKLRDV